MRGQSRTLSCSKLGCRCLGLLQHKVPVALGAHAHRGCTSEESTVIIAQHRPLQRLAATRLFKLPTILLSHSVMYIETRSCTDNYSSRNEDEPASKSLDVNSPLSPKGYRRLRRASAAPTASQYSGKISSRIQLQASQQDKSGAKIRSRHSQASNYLTKQKSTNLPRSRNKVTGHERGLKKHEFEKKTNCCRTRLPDEMNRQGGK